MSDPIQTSLSRNITPKISGIVPLWSFFSGLCGGMIGLLATLMIGLDIGPVQGFIALGCFTLFFSIHRAIIGGRYDYEFLDEKSMLRYKKKSSIEIDIEKKATLRKSRVPKDRFFLSPMGLAVIGFGIDESKIINFDTFMQNLMSKQKQGVRIRYMKKSSKGKGKIEPELTFLDSEIKIFIEVSNVSISRDDIITSFWNSLELYGSPLSLDEIRIFVKEMIAPGRSISEWEIKDGIFPSPLSLIRSEATLHYGDVAKQAGIISLAQLAVSISGNFQKILDVLGTLEGTICVTLESLGDQGVGAAIIRKQVEELDSKDKHDSEKEKTVASKFKLNSKLSIIALLHGSTEDLKNVEKELDANYRAIPSDELPYWRREYALFEKALDSMLPGHPITLPERRQRRIIDSQEASMYFPKPTYKGLDNPVVELKTASGQRFGFRLRKKYPLFIWSGVGDGKSVVLGYITKNYILRSKEGQKIATFTMETGGSSSFIHDDGLADLAFILEETGEGEFTPYPVPPLKLFFSFGTKGMDLAKGWIVSICKCEDDLFANLIMEALFELKESGKYRIKDLFALLEAKVKETYKGSEPSHYSNQYLTSLKRISDMKGSLYGKIFDVEDNNTDIVGAKHYYFTQKPAPKGENDLTKIHFEFAYGAFLCLETSLTGDNFHELLLIFDELDNAMKVKALSFSKVRSFNAHGRKEGKDIIMASQELEDLIDPRTGESLISSFKEFMFASSADANAVLGALKKVTSDGKDKRSQASLEEIDQTITDIRTFRTQKKMYMWALIDYRGIINLLNFTLPLKKIWEQASESAATELRSSLIKDFNVTKDQVIATLARFKMGVPEERSDIDQDKLMKVKKHLSEGNTDGREKD